MELTMFPAECAPTRRNFLMTAATFGAGVSGLTLVPQLAVSEESDVNIIGPKKGYSPQIGTLVSMMTWMRMVVLGSVKGMFNRHLNRSPAHVIPVRINIQRMFRLDPHARSMEVQDLFDSQVPAAIHSRKQTEQSEAIDSTYNANIQQTIIHPGVWRDLHTAPIGRRVRKSSKQSGLIGTDCPPV